MAVDNPSRNIPCNYSAGTVSRARCKKVTGGSLPSLPTKPPANQPKDYCGFLTGLRDRNDAG